VRYKFSKCAPTAVTQTKENVAMTNELVLSQEDETQTHHSTHPEAEFAVVWIFFSRRSWLEATPTESLTEAISYAILSSSTQSLSDVIFIWFTDKKSIRISHET